LALKYLEFQLSRNHEAKGTEVVACEPTFDGDNFFDSKVIKDLN